MVSLGPAGWLAAAALVCCLVSAPAGVAAQETAAEREKAAGELEETKRKLDASRERAEKLKRDMAAIAEERVALNKKLIVTARKVQESESKLNAIEERLAALVAQEDLIRESISERHETIAKLLAAMQRIGNQPPPAFVTRPR